MTSTRDDRSLADAARKGDERAFRELFQRHSGMLAGFLMRVANVQGDELDDLLQDTWVRAFEKLDAFRWESSLRSWLCGIALNLARRELGRRQWLEIDENSAVTFTAHEREERIDLEQAIAALPTGFRAVLVLHDVYGFTHEQIASHLGVQAGTSKSQLARARAAVREMIGSSYRSYT